MSGSGEGQGHASGTGTGSGPATTTVTAESSFLPFCNMLHSERLGSFLEGGWPEKSLSKSYMYLCTAQKLAQSGLEFHAKGEARCVVCWTVVKNLEPTTDPWIAHANANPDCALITLGKPSRPDDYTIKEFIELISERRTQYIKTKYLERKEELINLLATTYETEQGFHDEAH